MVGFWRSLSGVGLIVGAIFFAAALTPSLLPRPFPFQGALGGVCLAVGYGIGVGLQAVWRYLELPEPGPRARLVAKGIAAAVASGLVLVALARAPGWQNSIRAAMDMPPVETGSTLLVGLIAIALATLLLLIGRGFLKVQRLAAAALRRVVPPRVARIAGIGVAILLFAVLVDGLVFRGALRVADRSFAAVDALLEPEVPRPEDPGRTGSAASLIDWRDLGRAGREFISTGPGAAEIERVTGRPAMEPIRVYAGLNAAEDPAARAALTLAELIRVGGFERSVLVVAVPTGTGWMDPAATDSLEMLHGGDTAIVAMQYSYLTSYISILVEPGYGADAGRALFRAVYKHWTALPPEARPRLYLFGLSLGAISSEQSVRLHEVIGDPFHGAVWSGPPFPSPQWRSLTDEREPGSPAWLPRFEDGAWVRFANQEGVPGGGDGWGPMRIVYLQYASDPVVFFEPMAFWRRPAWMEPPRGPDVSPALRWYPVVTFFQLLADMAVGLMVPIGHGHFYAHADYINAWVAVTEPAGWDAEAVAGLKAHFAP